jgi:hypothetical protein
MLSTAAQGRVRIGHHGSAGKADGRPTTYVVLSLICESGTIIVSAPPRPMHDEPKLCVGNGESLYYPPEDICTEHADQAEYCIGI